MQILALVFLSSSKLMRENTFALSDMEPEMGAWSTLEYIAISTESAASGSDFYLTSVPPSLVEDLPESLRQYIDAPLKVTSHEVTQLSEIHADRVCLLDPQAEKELSPADAEVFDVFVFGGILGGLPDFFSPQFYCFQYYYSFCNPPFFFLPPIICCRVFCVTVPVTIPTPVGIMHMGMCRDDMSLSMMC